MSVVTVTPFRVPADSKIPADAEVLEQRDEADGTRVRLFWQRSTNRMFIAVNNNQGLKVTAEVPGSKAHYAFIHPYAWIG